MTQNDHPGYDVLMNLLEADEFDISPELVEEIFKIELDHQFRDDAATRIDKVKNRILAELQSRAE